MDRCSPPVSCTVINYVSQSLKIQMADCFVILYVSVRCPYSKSTRLFEIMKEIHLFILVVCCLGALLNINARLSHLSRLLSACHLLVLLNPGSW